MHPFLLNNINAKDGDKDNDKFRVVEQSDYCGLTGRCCCHPNHKLSLHVYAPEVSHREEVMVFDRPCKCGQCCACCNICRQEMIAYDGPPSKVGGRSQVGYIKQPFLGELLCCSITTRRKMYICYTINNHS